MYSFQLTKNIIGIDIGTYSLKIAECQRAGDKITLLNYEIKRFPKPAKPNQPYSRQEISAFIQHTLKEFGFRTTDAVSEVTGPWTVARHLFMPNLVDDELREAIRWGAKSDFPFSLEEAVIDFFKLDVFKRGEGEPEAEIITAVATRPAVEEQITLLRDAGLKPQFLSIPAFDMMQIYRFTQPSPWTETAVVIDMGSKNTRIVILKDGNLKFSREITVAGDAFTQALTGAYEVNGKTIEVDEDLAERIKLKIGPLEEDAAEARIEGVPLDQIQKRLGSVHDRLLLEVERSLTFYKNQFKDYEIKRVLLTGGGSLLKGLSAILEKNLEIPIQGFLAAGSLTLKKKLNEDLFLRNLPFLTPVLGLVTQIRPLINLSPAYLIPQARKVSYGKFLKPVLVSVLILGVLLGFAYPYWTAQQRVTRLKKELVSKKTQIARVGNVAEELARLEQEEAVLNTALEGLPKVETHRLSMADIFKELSRAVPSNMTLTRFQFSKSLESPAGLVSKAPAAKGEPTPDKTGDSQGSAGRGEGKPEHELSIQGIAFGSDQEIISTLMEFTRNLNRSNYFKEAKVLGTLKLTEFSKAAAEFKIQAWLGPGMGQVIGGAGS